MLYINKNQFVESGAIQTILEEDVIQVRRNATRLSNGEKETKLAPSQKVIKVVRNLLNVIVTTGINELCAPKSQLTALLKCDKKHTNDYIKNYFKGYGLGEYSFSNKYNITISGESKSIKRETHYYLYFNKETLELMRDTMEIEGIDWDELINQIPECERKCKIIENKTQTAINVLNYIDDEFIISHTINIEKNLFTKEGHYSKETSVINVEDDSVVEISKKENDFIPKAVEEVEPEMEVSFNDEQEDTNEQVELDQEELEVIALLDELKALQPKCKSRSLPMAIESIESTLASEHKDLDYIREETLKYIELYSREVSASSNKNNTGTVRRIKTLGSILSR